MSNIKIILKSGKADAVKRFHPWVFSGAIKKMLGEPADGALVDVYSNQDEFLGTGHYQDGSIAVRILTFTEVETGQDFWNQKIASAWKYRQALGLTGSKDTNAFRLVHAEGDGMPGLIIDFYKGTAVLQAHSVGMHKSMEFIAEALKKNLGDRLISMYDKSAETLPSRYAETIVNQSIWGEKLSETEILEHGLKMKVNWESGQKTGFFIDQRENRKLLMQYSNGRKVLNTFCYTGGFSLCALQAGATLVHSVDSSKKAVELVESNVVLNAFEPSRHEAFASDTMKFLEETKNKYDLIVLDPPAYAKHHDVRHNAVQGYKRLNAHAIESIAPGGILFTFSCSQVVRRDLFYSTVISAAITTGRNVRVLHHMSQAPDHPVNAYHPEGEYLKGLVLYIE
ncbi:MAG: class I SAM-dependent rRNA methyltransferase [Bacteroidota bacterium]